MAARGRSEVRTLSIVRELLEGKELDRHAVAKLGGVKLAAADRQLRAVERLIPGIASRREGRRRIYSFDVNAAVPPPGFPTVISASFGASLAPLFAGSNYEGGLREARNYVLRRARRKAEFKYLDRKFVFLHRGGDAALRDRAGDLDDIVDAVLHHRFVSIKYQHFDGPAEMIRTRPLSIAIYDHQLYMLGRSDDHVDYPYRFARILELDVENETFEYPPRAAYDPGRLFRDSLGVFASDVYPVSTIRIRVPLRWRNHLASHRWHPSQSFVEDGGGFVVTLQVRACPELEAWILGFAEEAEVLEPGWLRHRIGERIEKARAYYRPR